MRNETLPIISRLNTHFVGDYVYDMGGGYHPCNSSLVGGKKIKVVDYIPAPSVDIVDDLTSLAKIDDNSVDNIFCCDVLEHVTRPWASIENFHRVLKDDGVIFLTVPFIWHFHGHEIEENNWSTRVDLWRFTPAALLTLAHKFFETIECDWDIKPPLGPQTAPLWRCGAYFCGRKLKNVNIDDYEIKPKTLTW